MSDRGFAAQLAEDLSPEDLRMVLSVFQADVVRLVAALAAAVAAGDEAAFRRASHGLAGAAGAVGAAPLEQACRQAMDPGATDQAARLAAIRSLADAALHDLGVLVARLDAG